MDIREEIAAILPTKLARITVLSAISLIVPTWISTGYLVREYMQQTGETLLLLQILSVLAVTLVLILLALVSVLVFLNQTEKPKSSLRFYSNDDSKDIPDGIEVPILIFRNGEYSFPGDILCAIHKTPLTHEKDKHFCTIHECVTVMDMHQREHALTAADKLANRDIYKMQHRIPVEVDTYSSPMDGAFGQQIRKNKP